MLRAVQKEDVDKLVQLGMRTGVFAPGEAEELLGETLLKLLNNELPNGHQAHVLEKIGGLLGWAYFGPTEDAAAWNIWWIGVEPELKGRGYGQLLLKLFEQTARNSHAKQVIVETSSSPLLEQTRGFYASQGYQVSRTEPDAYGPGEDKIVFGKGL